MCLTSLSLLAVPNDGRAREKDPAGAAANTSATSGSKWRVKFTPDATGRWQYKVSFRVGHDAAASLDPLAGEPGSLDGITGEFKAHWYDPARGAIVG